MEKISGAPQGIEALKVLAGEDKNYLRFLLTEASTCTDHAAPFTGKDGVKYRLVVDPASGRMEVQRVG